MKKIITLGFFAIALFFSTQTISAQERVEDIAKLQVAKLSEAVQLTGEQQRTLFRVFVAKESGYAKQIKGKDLNNTDVAKAKTAIDATFEKELKAVLTAEQFKKYQDIKQ
ncbi:MAG: hypothetical protein COZ75_07670 [Flavobacteriaceae bacterium CG_4_8_14_3_um_filter_34_10]|nr:hypothetical protein [Flavobacteriia bacterium]OIP51851.1 MAG: hypothetical protein AUK33_02880 [Flavobacteriaceae bacterium CG2_30_34_30]PIQ17681.1 MAG: hypothetical protein COW66_10570 [Flavobacteriaceae bacterium CG18_big_fil_WC_8_21_14_2_50_34_36]PIV51384.1 MAG: hypothetical protein COS19_01250 [Flavobacteriaceae bacterium CG02_land_8_20_14_3_00_34_13]PIX09273.1 MAG: hypothetical protein COZ75_07670 [Flavobacteriaceae bacterium CG_4_8_14_3_um_filter_34_10]PIZ08383.1 MAG: hypothetical pr